jgi:hypothetical protein
MWFTTWNVSKLAKGLKAYIIQCNKRLTYAEACHDCHRNDIAADAECLYRATQRDDIFCEYWEIDTDGTICHGDCASDPHKNQGRYIEWLRSQDIFAWSANVMGCTGSHIAEGTAKIFLGSELDSRVPGWQKEFRRKKIGEAITLPERPGVPPTWFDHLGYSQVRKTVTCGFMCCPLKPTVVNCTKSK